MFSRNFRILSVFLSFFEPVFESVSRQHSSWRNRALQSPHLVIVQRGLAAGKSPKSPDRPLILQICSGWSSKSLPLSGCFCCFHGFGQASPLSKLPCLTRGARQPICRPASSLLLIAPTPPPSPLLHGSSVSAFPSPSPLPVVLIFLFSLSCIAIHRAAIANVRRRHVSHQIKTARRARSRGWPGRHHLRRRPLQDSLPL